MLFDQIEGACVVNPEAAVGIIAGCGLKIFDWDDRRRVPVWAPSFYFYLYCFYLYCSGRRPAK